MKKRSSPARCRPTTYNRDGGTTFKVVSWPDEEDRNNQAVEAVAANDVGGDCACGRSAEGRLSACSLVWMYSFFLHELLVSFFVQFLYVEDWHQNVPHLVDTFIDSRTVVVKMEVCL